MKAELAKLFELQKIDKAILQANKALAELDDGKALIAEAKRVQAALKKREQELSRRRADLTDAELELKRVEEKRDKTRALLHSGRITNPRELSSLEKEAQALDRARSNLDERVLLAMDDVERLQGEVDRLRADLNQRKQVIRKVLAEYKKRSAALNERLAELNKQRQAAAANISPPLLKRYDAVRNRLDGIGIVDASDGVCSGCRMPVPELVMRELKAGERVITCDNCTRILYIPEED